MKKHLLLSVIDQAVLSALSLGLSVVLIALARPEDFGHFVMVFSGLLFATSAQNALIITPLNLLLPGRESDEQAQTLGMLSSLNFLTVAVSAIGGMALCLLFPATPLLVASVFLYFVTGLQREYARNIFVVRGDMGKALLLDLIFIVLACLSIAVLWLWTDPVTAAVAGLGLANLVTLLIYNPHSHLSLKHFSRHWRDYGAVWRETRWALQGALQSEGQTRGYVFITEAWRDAVALGQLQAGRVLLSPLMLIASAWSRIARPRLVAQFHHDASATGLKILLGGVLTVGAACLVYAAAMALAWPLLEAFVFRGKYLGMGWVVALWWTQALFAGLNMVLGTLLQARRQFRDLALLGLATAVTSLLALLALSTTALPTATAVIILIACEFLGMAGCAWLIFFRGKSSTRAVIAGSTP